MKRFYVNIPLQISFALQKKGSMNPFINEELLELIQKATAGDKPSLETVMLSVQDLVLYLSLRILGTLSDAKNIS